MSTELAVINLKREMEKQNYILQAILEEMRKSNKMTEENKTGKKPHITYTG